MDKTQIDEIREDRARARENVRRLEAQLTAARVELDRLNTTIEVFDGYSQRTAEACSPPGTIADAARDVFQSFGGEAPVSEVVRALRKAGKLRGQRHGHYGAVITSIKRRPAEFERVREGVWRLRRESAGTANGAVPADREMQVRGLRN